MKIARVVTEYLLPLLSCPCCGKVNTAAVLLSSYGNVPSERAANLIGMLLGIPVSAGFVDLASERLSARLEDAGFDDAMEAALGKEPVLAADETPSTSWTRMPGWPARTRAHRTCLSSVPRTRD